MCNAPEKQYRKYYEQWQKKKKKSHVKLLSCRILFLFVPLILQNRFTTFLSFLLHIPLHSLLRDPWLVLLYVLCSSRDPTIYLQSFSYNHLLQLSFPDDEPNFTFLGSITCLLHMSTKMSLLSHFYNWQEIQFWTSNINSSLTFNLRVIIQGSKTSFFLLTMKAKVVKVVLLPANYVFSFCFVFSLQKKEKKKSKIRIRQAPSIKTRLYSDFSPFYTICTESVHLQANVITIATVLSYTNPFSILCHCIFIYNIAQQCFFSSLQVLKIENLLFFSSPPCCLQKQSSFCHTRMTAPTLATKMYRWNQLSLQQFATNSLWLDIILVYSKQVLFYRDLSFYLCSLHRDIYSS